MLWLGISYVSDEFRELFDSNLGIYAGDPVYIEVEEGAKSFFKPQLVLCTYQK